MGALRVLCCLSVGADAARSLTIAKWAYFALFTAFSVVTWLLRSYGEQIFVQNRLFAGVCADPTTSMTVAASALCSGQQLVLRFSFGAAAFFGAHALLLFWCRREGDFRLGLHTGGWAWKLLALAGSLVGFLFMPPTAVFYYGNVARFGAGLFLVFVMVEMVAWTYDLNEALVARDAWWSWVLLVSGAVISLAGGAALVGAAYYYYAPSPSCGLNIFLCTWSLVLGVAMIGVLFVPNRLEVAGLLTSGVVFAYASYLLLSALSSQPLSPCTRDMGVRQVAITVVGFFLGLGAVCYSTLTLGTSHIFGGGDADKRELPYRPDVFHAIFALACMYMAMLLSNWELSASAADMWRIDRGVISMWVKLGSKWFAEALYIWTVVAPAVCRGRDFSGA